MRSAKVNDYWRSVYSQKGKYSNYLSEVSFKDCNGLNATITFKPGITVLCGLNGAGKSSIIASIKGLLGISDYSMISKNKFTGQISGKIQINKNERNITFDSTAVNEGLDLDFIKYIDCDQAVECLKFWDQSNLDELLESEEEHSFTSEQIEDVSFIVGKDYSECVSYEISDEEKPYSVVYFKVKEDKNEYDSLGMGLGEHFLFYIYYVLENIKNDSVFIIEEPESFISVLSQERLIDYFAKIIDKKRISIIISTHSPSILKRINDESIRLITRFNGDVIVNADYSCENVEKILCDSLNIAKNKTVTVFVEDYVARVFLEYLLRIELPSDYKKIEVVSVNGESEITNRLQFDDSKYVSHKFIGVYDGDMNNDAKIGEIRDKIYWPYLFLPVDECVEKEILDLFRTTDYIKAFCENLDVEYEWMASVLSKRSGEDHHDRILNICKDLDRDFKSFIHSFYPLWKNENQEKIQEFVSTLTSLIAD